MLLFIAAVVCGAFSAGIARAKNRDGFGWFILGALFNLIALFAIAVIPALPARPIVEPKPRQPTSTAEKVLLIGGLVFVLVVFGGLTASALYS